MTTASRAAGHASVGSLTGGRLAVLLTVSLVLTGAAGLIYQVVWFRTLGLIFGVTVQATSAVLAAFMAGLAIGSFLAGWLVDRLPRPLRAYGIAELLIGAMGFASLPIFDLLQPVYRALATTVPDQPTPLVALRFVLAFLIMLIPTTMMGATLPIVVTALTRGVPGFARHVSRLYAANTLGAVAGAFVAAFYLIGMFGLTVTTGVAATMNILVGVLWLLVGNGTTIDSVAPEPEQVTGERIGGFAGTAIIVSYAVSGAVALGLEVVWTRILTGIFPGTVYSFAMMLCAVLTGIAVGSAALNPVIGQRRDWLRIYVILEIALGALALASLATLGQAYRVEAAVRGALGLGTDLLLGQPLFMALFALIAVGPSAFLMGVLFPIATRLATEGWQDSGRRLGTIYGANVLGAILGSLGTGLVLIPILGTRRTIALLAAGNVLAGLLILVARPKRSSALIAAAGAAVILVAAIAPPDHYAALFASDPRGDRVVWYEEGQDATIKVVRNPEGTLVLYINSEGQATDSGSELGYHYKLGMLGPLLHPNPKEMLVVGLGGGATSGVASTFGDTNVRVIELFPGVIEGAKWFTRANYDVLNRPNVSLTINDGRNYLLLADSGYDVIVADPILPTNAGAGNLYSADYYRLARQALRDDGLMIQWIDNGLPEYAYKLLLRSFLDVFPDATLWYDGTTLVGGKRPMLLDDEVLASKFREPAAREALANIGLRSVNDIRREYVAGADEIRAFVGDGPILTDRYPALEYARTLPASTIAADIRWRRIAAFLSARELPTDGIVFGQESLSNLLGYYHPRRLAEYLPPTQMTGREKEIDAALEKLLADRGRVWFIPWFRSDTDVYVENYLNTRAYKAINRELGNQRVTLYLSAKDEPALTPIGIDFADLVSLAGWSVDRTSAPVGDVLRVALDWRAIDDLDENIKVRLRLVGENGQVVSEVDRLPLDTPTSGWRDGSRHRDRIGLALPAGTPPGTYALDLALYREATGAPVRPRNPNAPGDRVILGSITVQPTDRRFSADAIDARTLSTKSFGNLRLAGWTVDTAARRHGDTIPVTLYWQPGSAEPRSATLTLGPVATGETAIRGPAGAIVRTDVPLRVRPGTDAGRYDLNVTVDGETLTLGRITIVEPPPLPAAPTPARTLNARFDPITLTGATVTPTADGLDVLLVWQAAREVEAGYAVFVHLVDSAGRVISQSDAIPAAGQAPTTSWLPGSRIADRHTIRGPIPEGARLVVGLYDPLTFQRLSAESADSVPIWP